MDETNNQDDTMEINNVADNVDEDNSDIEEEESDYDDDQWYKLNDDTLQRLKQNDQTVTNLSIPFNWDNIFDKINWKVDGKCISDNMHLKKIKISYDGKCLGRPFEQPYILGEEGSNLPTKQQLIDFFSCIYRNRSCNTLFIHRIRINDVFGKNLIEGLSGHPSLTSLEIGFSRLGGMGCEALGKVLDHPQSKVKHLHLPSCKLKSLDVICNALIGSSSTIKSLYLACNDNISPTGWRSLSTFLQHPNCRLVKLTLLGARLNDDTSNILGHAIIGSSVRDLNLQSIQLRRIGQQTLLHQLSHASIEKLNVSYNKIDDIGLASIANIGTLQSLNLSRNQLITPEGWQSFFNSLQRRGVQLKLLDITYNYIGNDSVAALGNLLSSMSTLKTLNMAGISSRLHTADIPSQCWVSLFTTLQDSNLNLARLDLSSNSIDNEGMQLLVPLVSRMSSLKCLRLNHNRSVTPTGWQALTGFFQSPNFVLKGVHLNENYIDDDTVVAFVSTLEHNKTLKLLGLEECFDDHVNMSITKRGLEAVSTLVCNKTSIMDTYNSNHILFVDCYDDEEIDQMDLPNVLPLLRLNGNKDKAEVARQKILQTHFPTEDDATSNIQEFLDMELEAMPRIVEWIGRPKPMSYWGGTKYECGWIGDSVSGLSLLYNLMRRLPDLFDSNAQKKK